MPEKQEQKKLNDSGFKTIPDYTLSIKVNDKWVKIGLYKREGKEGWSRKSPIAIPVGAYINLFKVEPLANKELKKPNNDTD